MAQGKACLAGDPPRDPPPVLLIGFDGPPGPGSADKFFDFCIKSEVLFSRGVSFYGYWRGVWLSKAKAIGCRARAIVLAAC